MKRMMSLLLAAAVIAALPAFDASAAGDSVRVTIPAFDVLVDDRSVDSAWMQYP